MSAGIFVTGTDTSVGKTLVACALTRFLVSQGLKVAVMKPVASGCTLEKGELRCDDSLMLMAESNLELKHLEVTPYAFEPAIAPHIAAQKGGVVINVDHIAALYKKLASRSDVVVVEGVGGWLVPLGQHQDLANVAKILQLPTLLVVGLRLGALNAAFLTAQSMQAFGAGPDYWCSSLVEDSMACVDENIATLEARLPGQVLGHLPAMAEPSLEAVVNTLSFGKLRLPT